jgi:hypothetical protein
VNRLCSSSNWSALKGESIIGLSIRPDPDIMDRFNTRVGMDGKGKEDGRKTSVYAYQQVKSFGWYLS